MTPAAAMLLLRGRSGAVQAWARKGLLPVWVVPDLAWTLVVPADQPRAAEPYDDPVALLGGRPVPARLRPSVCLVADGQRAVVAVHESARTAVQRWLVWTPGVGASRVKGLPHAPVRLLADLAGGHAARERLAAALRPDHRSGADVVDDLLRALELPGAGLPLGAVEPGHLPDAVRVDPDERVVERFDSFVASESRLQAELDGPR
jgi:hypothetical protein